MKTLEFLQKHLKTTASAIHWSKIGVKHHHGIALPLFSLRTQHSCGIGEFLDLLPIIDWLKKIGMDTIQLLPLNDTGEDPSPYNAISSKALNPIHLSLHALPYLEKYLPLQKKMKSLRVLSKSPRIAYKKVKQEKTLWLRSYFEKAYPELQEKSSFQKFQMQNSWLGSYALYKVLREKGENNTWQSWPKELRRPKDFDPLMKKYQEEIKFFVFLQYLCFEQMRKVRDYAKGHKVYLKGDIPILLSADSADVWTHPELFDLTLSAGAPPDAYSAEGQYWGFPIYNWKMHEKQDFSWWKERLRVASMIYHLYRIDHVVGFFRIWVIPPNKKAIDGHFLPKNMYLWQRQGKKLLKRLLGSSTLLPIAEDLGTIPKFVPQILKELGIAGTKVLRWERRWEEDANFIPVKDYEPISLTCSGTHDAESLLLWWEKYPIDAKIYAKSQGWSYKQDFDNDMREKILFDTHHSASLFHINPLQEYLAFFSNLIWPKAQEERINIPGTSSPFNWTYRFRPYVEEILLHDSLCAKMKWLIS